MASAEAFFFSITIGGGGHVDSLAIATYLLRAVTAAIYNSEESFLFYSEAEA